MLRPSARATRLFDSRKRHEVSWSSERKGGCFFHASIPRHTGTRIDHLNYTSTIMASLVTASTSAPFSTGVSLRGLRSKRTNTAPSAMAGGLRISPSRKGRRLQRQCRAVASRPDAPGQNLDDVLQQLESNVIELGPGENRARRNPRRPQPPTLLSAKYEKRPVFARNRCFCQTVFSVCAGICRDPPTPILSDAPSRHDPPQIPPSSPSSP